MPLSRWIATLFCLTNRNVATVSAMWLGLLLFIPTLMAEDVLPFADEAAEPMVIEPTAPDTSEPELDASEAAVSIDLPPTGNSEPALPAASHEGASPEGRPSGAAKKKNKPADTSAAHASIAPRTPEQEGPAPTKAEQINGLRQTIDADQKRVQQLKDRIADPGGEYSMAELEFREADRILQIGKKRIEELKKANDTAGVEALKQPFADAEAKWKIARERFDISIQTRETEQAKILALEEKIQHDQEALTRLTTIESPKAPAPAGEGLPMTPPADGVPPAGGAIVPASATAETAATTTPAAQPASAAEGEGAAATPPATTEEAKPPSKELAHAQIAAAEKTREADAAEQEAASVTERMQMLDKNIALQQKLVAGARRRRDLANEERKMLQKEYKAKSIAGASRSELESLEQKIETAEKRFDDGVNEVREGAETLDQMQSERAVLQSQEMAAMLTASEKRKEADDAQGKVKSLENPFTPRNILQWFIDHGPRLLAILLGMFVLQIVARVFSRRIVMILARSGARGSREEREDRAKTLVGVFHNTASLVIFVGSILVACEEVGIAVGPLMGGAAVFGLAVAFGAQNLIRDYFYGFMILLENQYKLNDVIQIGSTSGQVERITLRVTVLRDGEGRAHFVPNGKIETVTNMTHGWSRALFEIGVAYKEDADHVMKVLLDLAAELREDPVFGPSILDNAEMLGVDSFGDSAVTIKFFIKTRPLKQWSVKREMLRRIKRRFDELGIEIPYPHRTIFHHHAEAADKSATVAGDEEWGQQKVA